MKKNSKRKSNLKSSIILLLLMAILLVASSYAWFTSNQTVAVSSLDVNVLAQNGLQISVDGTNWKSIISKADLLAASTTYTTSVNQIPEELEPVSTAGKVDTGTGFLNMYYGEVSADTSGDYILTSTKSTETRGTDGKFIAFDMFLKVDAQTPVYLGTDSNVGYTTDKTDKGLQNASRVAMLIEGNTAAGSDLATIQGLKQATDQVTYVWEPNYDVHTSTGVKNAKDTYGITTTPTGGSVLPYEGVMAEFNAGEKVNIKEANSATHSTYFAALTNPKINTEQDYMSSETNKSLFTLEPGITKIRVYMWVEGQDVDCENNASGAYISYNLQITSLDKKAEVSP